MFNLTTIASPIFLHSIFRQVILYISLLVELPVYEAIEIHLQCISVLIFTSLMAI